MLATHWPAFVVIDIETLINRRLFVALIDCVPSLVFSFDAYEHYFLTITLDEIEFFSRLSCSFICNLFIFLIAIKMYGDTFS